jgi:hypothetical protein
MMQPPAGRTRKPVGRRARKSYWPVVAPLVAVVALAVVWSWLWYYAAAVADRTLSGWADREAAAGRNYTCGAQSIGGFPLGIHAGCVNATAEIKNSLPPLTVQAKAITFTAEVYRPTHLVGDVTGPLTLAELGHPTGFIADWTRARLAVSGIPPDPDSVSFDLDAPRVDRAGGGTIVKASGGDLRARVVGGSARDHPIIELTLHLTGAMAPTFHPLLADATDAEFDAVARGLKDLLPKPWADRFREMQAAGGDVEIKSFRITQADALVVGTGTLTVNAHGKLDGLIRVAIVGIERIVPRLGIDRMLGLGIDQLSGGEGALDRLMPGLSNTIRQTANASLIENLKKMGEASEIDKKPATVLPLRFADGAIYLGMLRVGEVPPLF